MQYIPITTLFSLIGLGIGLPGKFMTSQTSSEVNLGRIFSTYWQRIRQKARLHIFSLHKKIIGKNLAATPQNS
jgi:hypothetical protein